MVSSLHPANRPHPGDAERRRYARRSVNLPISATLSGDEIRIVCSNLSVGGARCHSESPIPVMTRLDVALALPADGDAGPGAGMAAVGSGVGSGGRAESLPDGGKGEGAGSFGNCDGRGATEAPRGHRREAGTHIDTSAATCAAGVEELHLHAVVVRCEPDPSGPGSWNLALFFVETESTPLERLARYLHDHHDSHRS